MRKLLTIMAMTLCVQSAMALTLEQQNEALAQLEVARAEINTVKNLIPGILRKTIGKNLENADQRIAYAQSVLAGTPTSGKHYCVIQTSIDGPFPGEGRTELEAKANALLACGKKALFCGSSPMDCDHVR